MDEDNVNTNEIAEIDSISDTYDNELDKQETEINIKSYEDIM